MLTHPQRLLLAWLGVAAMAVFVLWALAPVLSPFIAAGVLAYALSPSVDWLARHRVPRMVAVGLVEAAALIALLAVLLLVLGWVARRSYKARETATARPAASGAASGHGA